MGIGFRERRGGLMDLSPEMRCDRAEAELRRERVEVEADPEVADRVTPGPGVAREPGCGFPA